MRTTHKFRDFILPILVTVAVSEHVAEAQNNERVQPPLRPGITTIPTNVPYRQMRAETLLEDVRDLYKELLAFRRMAMATKHCPERLSSWEIKGRDFVLAERFLDRCVRGFDELGDRDEVLVQQLLDEYRTKLIFARLAYEQWWERQEEIRRNQEAKKH